MDLAAVLASFKKHHPEMVEHIRALTALKGTPAGESAAALLPFLLETYDDKEQAQWQLRDLVKEVPKVDGGSYYTLKYNATEEVRRIVAVSGLDATKLIGMPEEKQP